MKKEIVETEIRKNKGKEMLRIQEEQGITLIALLVTVILLANGRSVCLTELKGYPGCLPP